MSVTPVISNSSFYRAPIFLFFLTAPALSIATALWIVPAIWMAPIIWMAPAIVITPLY